MIGIIVSGHAQFASGLASSLEMIAGKQDNIEIVDFLEENPLETISEDIESAIVKLKETCEDVLIYTDLFGGTPFKTALMLAQSHENVYVLAGTNLGMLIDAAFSRLSADNVLDFAKASEATGKEQVQLVESIEVNDYEVEEGDGI
jgi:PTS system N-acetylgalactosamine-specific IIA component